MSSRTSPQTALLLAGAGAAAVLGSLWLPWYTIRFPDSFKDALGQLGGAASPAGSSSAPADQIAAGFGAMMKGLVAAIPTEITGDGWQTLGGADWALAILAGIALIAVLAVGGGLRSVRADAGATGRVIAGIGGICAAIALYHLVKKPGTGLSGGALGGFDDIITVRYGLYLAIAGGLLMVAGGLLAGRSGAPAAVPAEAVVPEAPAYTPPAPYAPPGAPHAAPVAADPFAAPAPVTAYAADPFAAPAPAVHATEPYAAPEPYAPGPAAAPPASPVLPAVPREPGTSVAPPGWAPPGA
ncbi:MAG: hypothetical protein MUF56_01160 [Solirubrobacteraceae bacterium]|nr:hypothetical protein [Solirubrobacteraceae bacterium]